MQAPTNTELYQALAARMDGLDPLAEKVARVHGDVTPDLIEARSECLGLAQALQTLGAGRDEAAASLQAAHALKRLRQLLHDYEPPAQACRSQRALMSGLALIDHEASAPLAALTGLEPLARAGA
jgi:iron-sulfur cluster repair protein YtfE (RIC family)